MIGRIASPTLFPLLVLALGTFAVVASTWDIATPLGVAPASGAALVLLLGIGIFYPLVALLERLLPYRREWCRSHGDLRTDALHLTITGPAMSMLHELTTHAAVATAGLWLATRLGGSLWPGGWSAPLQLGLALLVAELGHYGFHRLGHETRLVWRLHAVHHSAPRLYWLNATRFHPLDLFGLILCQSALLFLMGAPPRALSMYALFSTVYGQIQHANIGVRTPRVLDWIFSTPGVHRWHHSDDPREGNNNYCAVLSTWDIVFGTFYRPPAPFAGVVGIADRPDFPRGYLAQLASPFR